MIPSLYQVVVYQSCVLIFVIYIFVISIVPLIPVSGQINCTQWRKLNAYNTTKPLLNHIMLLKTAISCNVIIACLDCRTSGFCQEGRNSHIKRGGFQNFPLGGYQISANWGPNSRLDLEAIFKLLIPKSSQSSIMIIKLGKHEPRIVKANFGCVNSNAQILESLTAIQHGI